MPDITQLRFDYAALEPEIQRFVLERTERIHNLARMTAAGIVQIGQYLTEVKARLDRGEFLKWIEREFDWKQAQAYRFMQVYENVKITNLINLEIDVSALYLIAAPSTPEPVRSQAMQRAENGEVVTHAGTRALTQHFAETGELPDIQVDLAELIKERRALMKSDQPKPEPPSPEERQTLAEVAQREAKKKAAGERNLRVFRVIESIEQLCATTLTVAEIAAEIRRLDTPDMDWQGQLKIARRKLADLAKELSE